MTKHYTETLNNLFKTSLGLTNFELVVHHNTANGFSEIDLKRRFKFTDAEVRSANNSDLFFSIRDTIENEITLSRPYLKMKREKEVELANAKAQIEGLEKLVAKLEDYETFFEKTYELNHGKPYSESSESRIRKTKMEIQKAKFK